MTCFLTVVFCFIRGLNTARAVDSRLKGRLYIAALLPYFANRKRKYRMVLYQQVSASVTSERAEFPESMNTLL